MFASGERAPRWREPVPCVPDAPLARRTSSAARSGMSVAALAERRQDDLDDAKPVVEVFAKGAVLDHLLEVAVRGGDHARLGAFGLLRAQRLELAILDDAQQLGLELRGRVADLVEEDRAAPREREAALAGAAPRR